MDPRELARVHDQLVTLGLTAVGILMVFAGVAGRVLLRRDEERLGTLLVPVIVLVAAAAIAGTVAGLVAYSGGYIR